MKNIKSTLLIVAIFSASLINNSYAKSGLDINKKLDETVKFEDGTLSLEKNKTDFVRISFKINKEGKFEVLALNYSNEEIKKQLISKLSEITFEGTYNSNEIYNYNFSFKKV